MNAKTAAGAWVGSDVIRFGFVGVRQFALFTIWPFMAIGGLNGGVRVIHDDPQFIQDGGVGAWLLVSFLGLVVPGFVLLRIGASVAVITRRGVRRCISPQRLIPWESISDFEYRGAGGVNGHVVAVLKDGQEQRLIFVQFARYMPDLHQRQVDGVLARLRRKHEMATH